MAQDNQRIDTIQMSADELSELKETGQIVVNAPYNRDVKRRQHLEVAGTEPVVKVIVGKPHDLDGDILLYLSA